VPLSLDPDGAYFIGAKVGRRSLEVLLVDFTGAVRHRIVKPYVFPRPEEIVGEILSEVRICEATPGIDPDRIAGLGIAIPFEFRNWSQGTDAPAEAMAAWRHVDIRAELADLLSYPVYIQNDATAACGAELAFGDNAGLLDYIHFYIGAFVGGGLVLNGSVFTGRTGNAAALGSMPVPDGTGGTAQLIDRASLVLLERRLLDAELSVDALYGEGADWGSFEPHLEVWIREAAQGIAHAISAATAIIDFEAAVIDGAMPNVVLERLLAHVAAELARLDLSGIEPPQLRPGTIGSTARALGGASLPLFDRYLLDQHRLVRSGSPRSSQAAASA
jgi:predicted NBD/HSP70 family sugar kinase